MTHKLIIAAAIALGLFAGIAYAASTATPVIPGSLVTTTTGAGSCGTGPNPCWRPYGPNNPLPAITTP